MGTLGVHLSDYGFFFFSFKFSFKQLVFGKGRRGYTDTVLPFDCSIYSPCTETTGDSGPHVQVAGTRTRTHTHMCALLLCFDSLVGVWGPLETPRPWEKLSSHQMAAPCHRCSCLEISCFVFCLAEGDFLRVEINVDRLTGGSVTSDSCQGISYSLGYFYYSLFSLRS